MYLEFPPLVRNGGRFINSSPAIFPPLSDYACVNQPFFFDFSGTDADGDELRYSLVAPLSGNSSFSDPRPEPSPAPYPTVQFISGIGVGNMIPGNPPLQINNNGILSVTASQAGLYVFAVLIEEFRNGQKIGEVRRDYQLLVIDCPTANAPEARYKSNDSPNFYTEGTVLEFEAGEDNCGKLFITDIDANSQIKVRALPVNFDDAGGILKQTTGTVNGAGDVLTIDACYPKCPNPNGEPYIVDFVIEDNSCAVPLMDTVRVLVNIVVPPNLPPTIITDAVFDPVTQCYEATVKIGELLTVEVTGDDQNDDIISLSALGDLPAGSNFTGGKGAPPIKGTFTWQPPCDALNPDETERIYNIRFQAQDERACDSAMRAETCLNVKVIRDTTENLPPEITTHLDFDPIAGVYRYDSVFVGETVTFPINATDPEGDSLALSFLPFNFNADGRNISFAPTNGFSPLNATFTWQTSCKDLDNPRVAQEFIMDFIVRDFDECGVAEHADTLRVVVVLLPRPNLPPLITTDIPNFEAATKTYRDTLTLGVPYQFKIFGDDPNNDKIFITGNGVGFNFADLGIQFTPVEGFPILETEVIWNTPCDLVEKINLGQPIEMRFQIRDENPCENSLNEEIIVILVVMPPNPDNQAPEATTSLVFNPAQERYEIEVEVGQQVNFDVFADDPESNYLLLTGQGVGFDFADFGMEFTDVEGVPQLVSPFKWQTLCKHLEGQNEREFLLRFIATEKVDCQPVLADTVLVLIRLRYTPRPNEAPEVSTSLTFDNGAGLYRVRVEVNQPLTFNVFGDDPDLDFISLEGYGVGYDLSAVGMQFENKFGQAPLSSPFRWTPTCENLGANNRDITYLVEFLVTDIGNCDRILTDTVRVEILLTPDLRNTPPTITTTLTDSLEGVFLVDVPVGTNISFDLIGDDADKERISLSGFGVGFNLADLGMQFENVEGLPTQSSTFSWTPDCSFLEGASEKTVETLFIVEDETKCGLRASAPLLVRITVRDNTQINDFLPANVFTPNNDGINDTFRIPNLPLNTCSNPFVSIKIFNRWGTLVFESQDRNFEWDGIGFAAGTYFYLIEFKDQTYKNWVSLLVE
jgi:gliding motility-associated-like protein